MPEAVEEAEVIETTVVFDQSSVIEVEGGKYIHCKYQSASGSRSGREFIPSDTELSDEDYLKSIYN